MDFGSLKRDIDATDYLTRKAPLTESAVAAFEQEHAVALPEQYRRALLELGDGVDSDALVFLGLDEAADLLEGELSAPFPYSNEYAELILGALATGVPFDDVMAKPEVRAGQRKGMPAGCLVVGDYGGGQYSVLVVTGAQRGKIWRNGDVDCPETRRNYDAAAEPTPLDFDAWLTCWVRENGVKPASSDD